MSKHSKNFCRMMKTIFFISNWMHYKQSGHNKPKRNETTQYERWTTTNQCYTIRKKVNLYPPHIDVYVRWFNAILNHTAEETKPNEVRKIRETNDVTRWNTQPHQVERKLCAQRETNTITLNKFQRETKETANQLSASGRGGTKETERTVYQHR